MAALLVTLSLAQFQLHSQGSGGSDRHWWWEVVHVHDESLHSRARIATLEQQPVSIRLEEGRGIINLQVLQQITGSAAGALTQNDCPW